MAQSAEVVGSCRGAKHVKRIALAMIGVLGALLGGLWLLQGLGLVHIAPVLCVADCEPVQGASPTWAIIGLAVLAAGLLAIYLALKRRTPP